MPNDVSLSRIQRIIDLCTSGQWQYGKTSKMLAEEWGLSDKTVQHYRTQALRIIRKDFGKDSEGIRTELMAKLDRAYHAAMQAQGAVATRDGVARYENPDVKGAVIALKELATLLGLRVTVREIKKSIEDKRSALQGMSDEELAEHAAKLRERASQVEEATDHEVH